MDFDLSGTAGYAIARRALPLDLPPNYELSFYMRADAPVNNLQFKLIDDSGDNVWWFNRSNFEFPREWQLVKIKRRQIEFAWGPAKDRTLTHAATDLTATPRINRAARDWNRSFCAALLISSSSGTT